MEALLPPAPPVSELWFGAIPPAYAERAQGRVALAAKTDRGRDRLERAIALFARHGMELEVGRTRLDLARSLREFDRQAAIHEGRAAMSALHAAHR